VIAWPIAELLPHCHDMVLLDGVVRFDEDSITCVRTLRPGGLFQQADGGLPAWAGMELMAQAIAAWLGCRGRATGEAVRPGLLLGTREFHCDTAIFPVGTNLRIAAARCFHDDDGMGAFACRIDGGGHVAQARLTVFSPPDTAAFFATLAQETHA
jgi:predicted hotdog family 3-hydroxylacyl-ACP dehydratase